MFADFDPSRSTRIGRSGRILITAKDEGSILRKHVFDEIVHLDALVRNLTIEWNGERLRYADMCSTWKGKCWGNEILKTAKYMDKIEAGEMALTYPMWFDLETFDRVTFPFLVGGVKLNEEDHTIASIFVGSLNYFLSTASKNEADRGAKWEDALLRIVDTIPFRYIDLAKSTSLTLEKELNENTRSVVPYFSLNIGIMIAFCILTCMMTDWVKSKPLLGFCGIASCVCATLASFGFIMYLGMPFTGINLAVPFLMLGKWSCN